MWFFSHYLKQQSSICNCCLTTSSSINWKKKKGQKKNWSKGMLFECDQLAPLGVSFFGRTTRFFLIWWISFQSYIDCPSISGYGKTLSNSTHQLISLRKVCSIIPRVINNWLYGFSTLFGNIHVCHYQLTRMEFSFFKSTKFTKFLVPPDAKAFPSCGSQLGWLILINLSINDLNGWEHL